MTAATPRLVLDTTALTPAQEAVADKLRSGPRGALRGPFVPMIHSPEFTDRTQALGEYLRYNAHLPEALKEFAILVTARHWDQSYEWHVHAPIALKAGAPRDAIAAVAAREAPGQADYRIVHGFCAALHRDHEVDDATYGQALALLGEAGVVDLIGLCGYYTLLAMVLNVARPALPEGAVPFAIPG